MAHQRTETTSTQPSVVVLPFLDPVVALIAHNQSGTGLDYKKYINQRAYTYTAKRLKRIYNRHNSFTDVIQSIWRMDSPGFIIYAKSKIIGEKIKYIRKPVTQIKIDQALKDSFIVRLDTDEFFPHYEAYYVDGTYNNKNIMELPLFNKKELTYGNVLPIFNSSTIIYGIGTGGTNLQLPQWYRVLEGSVNTIKIDTVQNMKLNNINLNDFRCINLNSYDNTIKDMNNSKLQSDKLCLIIDPRAQENELVRLFNSKKYYTLIRQRTGLVRLILDNGSLLFACRISQNFANVMFGMKGVEKGVNYRIPDDNDLLMRFIFTSEDKNPPYSWSPYQIGTTKSYKFQFMKWLPGYDITRVYLMYRSILETLPKQQKRMYIIGRKGSFKSSFFKYVSDKPEFSKVYLVDVDQWYGYLALNDLGQEYDILNNDGKLYEYNAMTKLIEAAIKESKRSKNSRAWTDSFGKMYSRAITHDKYGIQKWQYELEQALDGKYDFIIYFMQSDIETRHMFPSHPILVLNGEYKNDELFKKRAQIDNRYYEKEISLYLNLLIPNACICVNFIDLLLLFGASIEPMP